MRIRFGASGSRLVWRVKFGAKSAVASARPAGRNVAGGAGWHIPRGIHVSMLHPSVLPSTCTRATCPSTKRCWIEPEVSLLRRSAVCHGSQLRSDAMRPAVWTATTVERKPFVFFCLQSVDMDTTGIPGLLQFVEGLPMRLTESVDRKLIVFNNMTCVLRGWQVQDCESSVLDDHERAFAHMPSAIYVHVSYVSWTVGTALGAGVFFLVLFTRSWLVYKGNKPMCAQGFYGYSAVCRNGAHGPGSGCRRIIGGFLRRGCNCSAARRACSLYRRFACSPSGNIAHCARFLPHFFN